MCLSSNHYSLPLDFYHTECPPDVLLDDHLKAKVYEKNYTGRSSARMTTWRQKNVKKLHYPVDRWFDKITNPSALDGTLDIKGNFYTNLVKILMHHWRCPQSDEFITTNIKSVFSLKITWNFFLQLFCAGFKENAHTSVYSENDCWGIKKSSTNF